MYAAAKSAATSIRNFRQFARNLQMLFNPLELVQAMTRSKVHIIMALQQVAVFAWGEIAGVGLEFRLRLSLMKRKVRMEPRVERRLRCGGSAVKLLDGYPWF